MALTTGAFLIGMVGTYRAADSQLGDASIRQYCEGLKNQQKSSPLFAKTLNFGRCMDYQMRC
jgi:hypothetical protein